MSKFKVGDKVKLKSGLSCINLNHINVYTVRKSYADAVALIGLECSYAEHIFMLYEESKNEGAGVIQEQKFEVGDEEDMSEILTPLQAADAILHKEFLQEFCEDTGNWHDFHCGLKYITLDMLTNTKFRHKPKTIVINGVEVPAPLDTKSLGYPDKVYGLNFSRKSVYDTTGHTNRGLFWATEEDAQRVLDAMLIPFNKLNKGESHD